MLEDENKALYRMLLGGVRDAIYLHDADGNILEVNPAATIQTGYDRDTLVRMQMHELNPYRQKEDFRTMLAEMIGKGEQHRIIHSSHRHASGKDMPVEVSLSRIEYGSRVLFVAAVRDISQRQKLKQSVEHKVRFNQLMLDISSRLVNLDPDKIDDTIQDVLANIGEFFNVDRSYIFSIDWNGDTITNTHEWTAPGVCPAMDRLQEVPFGEFPWLRKHMAEQHVAHAPDVDALPEEARQDREEYRAQEIQSLVIVPVIRNGETRGMFGLDAVREKRHWDEDIRDNLRLLAQILAGAMDAAHLGRELKHMAYHDVLTQLPNRKLLKDRINLAIKRCRRNDKRAAVMLLDIDDFKLINDTLTHAVGDELLCEIADRLQLETRETDTVARLGGDEFVMVCELDDADDIALLAERIIAAISKPIEIQKQHIVVHASIGITLMPDDETDQEKLLRNADLAMYEAKGAGKNRFAFFDPSMGERAQVLLELRYELQQAIDNNELLVYYQPLYDLRVDRICGFEALVRWQHPKKGLLEPEAFLPIAERSDLICKVDHWVMRQACVEAAGLCAGTEGMRIGVNLSARDLYERENVDRLIEYALEFGPEIGGNLQLEITESMLMQDVLIAIEHLQRFTSALPEVSIAIDDFGSGYSSLNYLRRLPIDTLKIDRAFVADLQHDSLSAEAIIRSIIELARNLNLQVIAEGVETEYQHQMLRVLGCDRVQGFLFGKPVPIDEIKRLLQSESAG